MKYDGILTAGANINLDSGLFNQNKALYVHKIQMSLKEKITGFPQNAYPYGILLTFMTDSGDYAKGQFYIPHSSASSENHPVYVRTFMDGNTNNKKTWRAIQGVTVDAY